MILADCFRSEHRKLVDLGGPKMSVTNVAEYYFHHDREFWLIEEFKQATPPFEKMWIEYRYPRMVRSTENGGHNVQAYFRGVTPYFGCFVGKINSGDSVKYFPEEILKAAINDARQFALKHPDGAYQLLQDPKPGAAVDTWLFKGTMYFVNSKNEVESHGDIAEMAIRMDREGRILAASYPKFMEESIAGMPAGAASAATRAYYLHPILLAFSFRNCKNIEVVDVQAPVKLQKARVRRGKEPLVRYSVVNVLPLANLRSPRSRSVESADGQGVALHIRAGNFAHYGEKFGRKKLFGKFEGMYWRPQATVGSLERGLSVHDYSVEKVSE